MELRTRLVDDARLDRELLEALRVLLDEDLVFEDVEDRFDEELDRLAEEMCEKVQALTMTG